mmetsp:Transcript_39320/g.121577  ORF Transcript_39320/g.121577 Transcript_39320/m.121577 type:complete len:359 (-) Transcript_39320:1466-2542(-)|eukprot:CAMPEP_0174852136 /NCGR_PEP_ID=MMETSP1114-20130205/25201_1 /TAXON_ID=312471 /ORGANISM="Neobodo designis, Strain CCAP 1951/1" /LENGTH=358 /DNA_ID=CAMNT_0016086715 /DNA_START=746 /DNA_END=1822 /DNA_ORIENTATION=-
MNPGPTTDAWGAPANVPQQPQQQSAAYATQAPMMPPPGTAAAAAPGAYPFVSLAGPTPGALPMAAYGGFPTAQHAGAMPTAMMPVMGYAPVAMPQHHALPHAGFVPMPVSPFHQQQFMQVPQMAPQPQSQHMVGQQQPPQQQQQQPSPQTRRPSSGAGGGAGRPSRRELVVPPPAPGDTEPGPRQLIVNYIAVDMTSDELRALFEPFGDVEVARVVEEPDAGHNRGFGFVYFRYCRDAAAAIEGLSGRVLRGKRLRVSYAIPQRPMAASAASPAPPSTDATSVEKSSTAQTPTATVMEPAKSADVTDAAAGALPPAKPVTTSPREDGDASESPVSVLKPFVGLDLLTQGGAAPTTAAA